MFSAFALGAEAEPFNSYTNHAGNVIAGWPVKLTATHVTLAERILPATTEAVAIPGRDARPARPRSRGTRDPTRCTEDFATASTTYPLSIFPESERRRIAADFLLRQGGGQVDLLRIPVAVKRAITGAEKAIARSRKRAEKGLCTKEESEAFCEKSEAALRNYLDKQVKEGTITPTERKALGR